MDPYLAEIRLFAGNFAPRSWAFCNGAILPIASNDALFSLIGTTYGGDGSVTFALPDFRGRAAIGSGQGPGLTNRVPGQVLGMENVTLTTPTMPAHTHVASANVNLGASNSNPGDSSPAGNYFAQSATDTYSGNSNSTMGQTSFPVSVSPAGGSQPHNNMMPFLALNYIIAVEGIYPSRS